MITEIMLVELTIIAFLTGMLAGCVGTVLAFSIKNRIDALERKVHEQAMMERDFSAAHDILHSKESK